EYEPIEDVFTADIDAFFPFLLLKGCVTTKLLACAPLVLNIEHGIAANVTVQLKLPADRYNYEWRLREVHNLSPIANKAIKYFLRMFFRGYKSVIPSVTESEIALTYFERILSGMERFRDRTALVKNKSIPAL
ncbi:hypothetical protein BVRB_035140, partial [Beta vulgaris subsp. vulgaris]